MNYCTNPVLRLTLHRHNILDFPAISYSPIDCSNLFLLTQCQKMLLHKQSIQMACQRNSIESHFLWILTPGYSWSLYPFMRTKLNDSCGLKLSSSSTFSPTLFMIKSQCVSRLSYRTVLSTAHETRPYGKSDLGVFWMVLIDRCIFMRRI